MLAETLVQYRVLRTQPYRYAHGYASFLYIVYMARCTHMRIYGVKGFSEYCYYRYTILTLIGQLILYRRLCLT